MFGLGAVAIAAIAGLIVIRSGGPSSSSGPVAWATLRTRDVHSLAFDPGDARHLYFGHHGGLLESRDGGRSWQPTALANADAMNLQTAGGGFLQIAGHNVFLESLDGGRTWRPVPNDLPGLDLHSFAFDPSDPSHAWAFAVGFGLFETADRGRHWELRQPGDWGALAAFREAGKTVLLGVGRSGVSRSEDGGQTWSQLAQPRGQIASLATGADGPVLYAGTTEGVSRSADGARTWTRTGLRSLMLALASHPTISNIVAAVDEGTRFFRSEDGGTSWPGP